MAETMQGQRKWGYQTLHWWRGIGKEETSFWSAHMNPRSETSLHMHKCESHIVCAYGNFRVWNQSTGVMFQLVAGSSIKIRENELHVIINHTSSQCGFLEIYRGSHVTHEPVTIRPERTDGI